MGECSPKEHQPSSAHLSGRKLPLQLSPQCQTTQVFPYVSGAFQAASPTLDPGGSKSKAVLHCVMYHSFVIHSSADGHLSCFQILAIRQKVCCDEAEDGTEGLLREDRCRREEESPESSLQGPSFWGRRRRGRKSLRRSHTRPSGTGAKEGSTRHRLQRCMRVTRRSLLTLRIAVSGGWRGLKTNWTNEGMNGGWQAKTLSVTQSPSTVSRREGRDGLGVRGLVRATVLVFALGEHVGTQRGGPYGKEDTEKAKGRADNQQSQAPVKEGAWQVTLQGEPCSR
ncbi:uncharacterized protein WM277_025642 isoform 1-T2 [Molossus nigricans]